MTTTKKQSAGEVLIRQSADILQAIELLKLQLDTLTADTDPESATWSDVSQYSHVSDAAREVIERLS